MFIDKTLYWVGAVFFFLTGFYQAYQHHYLYMAALFIAMAYCLGFAMRGRNTWMM